MLLENFNDYTPIKILGQGQFHTLYLVHSPNQSKYVLKLIQINKNNLNHATEKAKSYLSLKHPNIINAKEFFFYKQQQFLAFVLEYCPDGDLSGLIGKTNEDQSKQIIKRITEGLVYLHQNKIVHRDIRPENIMMMNGTPKIAELGISKLMTTFADSTIVGTPFYLAPEGFTEENLDQKCDIWSLGIISLELLVGKRIYEFAPGDRAPALRGDFPCQMILNEIKCEELRDLVQKMLKKKPQERVTSKQLFEILSEQKWEKLEAQEQNKNEDNKSKEFEIKQQNKAYKFNQNKKSQFFIQFQGQNRSFKRQHNSYEFDLRGSSFFCRSRRCCNEKRQFYQIQNQITNRIFIVKQYVAVGLGVRNYQMSIKGFQNPKQVINVQGFLKMAYELQDKGKFDYGFFLLFNSGQIIYPSNKKHNQQYTQFRFRSGDVVRIETNDKELIFLREQGDYEMEQYKIPINLTEAQWKQACFCVCLAGCNDQVSILPPLQPPKANNYGCQIQ